MTPVTRPVSALPAGIAYARFLKALALSRSEGLPAAEQYAREWRDSPQVSAALEGCRTKAAVPAGSLTDSAWAGVLSDFGIASDALTVLRGFSIFERLKPSMSRRPFRVNVPRQTGAGTAGYWVAEGAAVPATSYAFDQVFLDVYKAQLLYVVTQELLRAGESAGEQTLRDVSLAALAAFLDQQFLDPTITAATGRPASITNGATAITSTGGTAAQITTDLTAMLAAIDTSGRSLTWIMRPTTLAHLALALGGSATDLPRSLFGMSVIASSTSPAQVTLVDAAEILYADEGDFEIKLGGQASLEMSDAPTQSSLTPTATTLVSMFQTDSIAYRFSRWLSWERVRAGAVAYMVVTY